MKKFIALMMALAMVLSLVACSGAPATTEPAAEPKNEGPAAAEPSAVEPVAEPEANLTATQQIIREAEGMSLEELAKKAIEESNGATFYGVGNPIMYPAATC